MKKSKLIELLSTLSVAECRQFEDFLNSPYFNKNPEVCLLWRYLAKYHPNFPEGRVKKETVFSKIFPGAAFDGKQLSYLMNYLLKLGEEFLLTQQYRNNNLQNRYYLMSEFLERQLYKHFKYTYKKTQEELEEKAMESSNTYFHKHRITELFSDYNTTIGNQNEPHIQHASDQFDDYFLLTKIKYSCAILNRTLLISPEFNISYLDEVIDFVMSKEDRPLLIDIYFKILVLLKSEQQEKEEQIVRELLEVLNQSHTKVQQEELRHIYKSAINFCIQRFREGKKEFLDLCWHFYNGGIISRALFEKGVLSSGTYTNTIRLGIMLGRFNLTEQFIQKNTQFLEKSVQKDALHYNLALVSFNKKEFGETLAQLNQMPFVDQFYIMINRVLMIKAYYETEDEDPLLSALASFSIYLKRNKKTSVMIKKTYLNFCNLLNQILRRNPKKKELVRERIASTQPLIERQWLMDSWKKEFA